MTAVQGTQQLGFAAEASASNPTRLPVSHFHGSLLRSSGGPGKTTLYAYGHSYARNAKAKCNGYQVNPVIFASIALLLVAITTLAAWTPARHASRIDPTRALRDE